MNYLAHVYLSCSDEALLVGNFIADSCRNKDLEILPPDIMKGIELHRSIDSYTDQHPLFLKSTKRFYKRHGKYASVLTDIVYDVYLIRNWKLYSVEELSSFTQSVYPSLLKYKEIMPTKLKDKIEWMVEKDFLMRYTTEQGFLTALESMDKRTKFPSKFSEAILDMEENDKELNEEFNAFFPDLIQHVDAICNC